MSFTQRVGPAAIDLSTSFKCPCHFHSTTVILTTCLLISTAACTLSFIVGFFFLVKNLIAVLDWLVGWLVGWLVETHI